MPTVTLWRDALMSLWRCPRWLRCADWSKTFEMTQSIFEQKASCAGLSAKPPAERRPMLADLPSELRVTLYSGPSYLASAACEEYKY